MEEYDLVALEDLEDAEGFYGCPVYLVPKGTTPEQWRSRIEVAMGKAFPKDDEDWLYDELPDALIQVGWIPLGPGDPFSP